LVDLARPTLVTPETQEVLGRLEIQERTVTPDLELPLEEQVLRVTPELMETQEIQDRQEAERRQAVQVVLEMPEALATKER